MKSLWRSNQEGVSDKFLAVFATFDDAEQFILEMSKRYDRDTLTGLSYWEAPVKGTGWKHLVSLVFNRAIDGNDLRPFLYNYPSCENFGIPAEGYVMFLTTHSRLKALGSADIIIETIAKIRTHLKKQNAGA